MKQGDLCTVHSRHAVPAHILSWMPYPGDTTDSRHHRSGSSCLFISDEPGVAVGHYSIVLIEGMVRTVRNKDLFQSGSEPNE